MPCFGHPLERSCQQFFVQVIYSVGRPVVTMTFHRHVTVGLIATYYWLELETSPDATFRCPIENDGRTYIPSVLVDDSNHKLSSPSANARRPCKGKRFSCLPCFRFLPHDNLYQNHNKDSMKLPGNTILQICRFYPNKAYNSSLMWTILYHIKRYMPRWKKPQYPPNNSSVRIVINKGCNKARSEPFQSIIILW